MSRNALLTPGSARLLVAYSGPIEPPAALPSESERVVIFIGGLDDGNFAQPEPLLRDFICKRLDRRNRCPKESETRL